MPIPQKFIAREVPIDQIHAWPDNPRPRTQFTADALADILPSIQADGIIEPIVLRTRPQPNGGYWIVAGERRYQAAKLAGLVLVPATFRECDDTTALQLALAENVRRKNLEPLDEGLAYARLAEMDAAYRELKALAAFVSMPVAHVRRRLKLTQLSEMAREALTQKAITAAHGEKLASLTAKEQAEALENACFGWLAGNKAKLLAARNWAALTPALESIDVLDSWIRNNAALNTKDAEVQQDLIEELGTEQPEGAPAVTPEMLTACLRLSEQNYLNDAGAKKLGVLTPSRWKEVNPARPCEYAQPALIAHGGRRRVLYACVNPKCKQHLGKPKAAPSTTSAAKPSTSSTPAKPLTPAQIAAQREQRIDDAQRDRLPIAVAKHIQLKKPAATVLLDIAILASGADALPDPREVEKRAKVKIGNAIGLYLGLTIFVSGLEDDDIQKAAKLLKFDLKKFRQQIADELKAADAKKTPKKGAA